MQPSCLDEFPPSGREGKLAKISINMKNLRKQGRECQHFFLIIHHYETFDYHCCKACCVLTVSVLPGSLQAHCIAATNSCVPCSNDTSVLCARMCQSGGSTTLCLMHVFYCLSLCSQCPKRGQYEPCSCQAWKGGFHNSHGKQVQPN